MAMPEFSETTVLDHQGEINIGLGAVVVIDGDGLGRKQVVWADATELAITNRWAGTDALVAYSVHRIMLVLLPLMAVLALVWIWLDAIKLPEAQETRALHSTMAALATLLIMSPGCCASWRSTAIYRASAPDQSCRAPTTSTSAPGSRLQTMLPLLRAAFGILVAVIAALIVLSRLGIDTTPLIAGAGVFGLAISFGSQSLVRDIISGLFYMWDDSFRVGEYIDTGRLKATVEKLGIRSLKLRHHNGPLHTIPYGQLGAVTNFSRDFATIKFNLKLEAGTDIELVRRTAKQIGLAMQQNSEIADEVMLPLELQGIAEIMENAVVARFKFTARPVKTSRIARIPEADLPSVRREGYHLCVRRADLTDRTAPTGFRRNPERRAAARGSPAKTGAAGSSRASAFGAQCRLSCPPLSCRATIAADVVRARSKRASCHVASCEHDNRPEHPKVRAWLTRHPRWTFHFTPTSCSWANAVEGFFATLTRRAIASAALFTRSLTCRPRSTAISASATRQPKPFIWTADPNRIIEKVTRGNPNDRVIPTSAIGPAHDAPGRGFKTVRVALARAVHA